LFLRWAENPRPRLRLRPAGAAPPIRKRFAEVRRYPSIDVAPESASLAFDPEKRMCGRYTIKTPRRRLEEHFGLGELPDFEPRYNLAPSQDGLVVLAGEHAGARRAALMRWGLIPSWTRHPAESPLLFNARGETAATKPAFRDSLRRRRCLVVADGFYEWPRAAGPHKHPVYFTVDHGAPFAMAGLWDRWTPPAGASDGAGEPLETFAVLTTTANDVLAPHHDRMPVILDPKFYDDWLNPFLTQPETVERLLGPFPAMRMLARAVGSRVNSIKFDDPACLEPPEPPGASAPRPNASGQLDLGLGD
jgi:putative SOS response-associated peptidase YedK